MKLARIAAQVTSAVGAITTGAGIKVIQHAPIVAPFVLILRAFIAVLNSIGWAVDTLAGGEDGLKKERSALMDYIRSSYANITSGKAKPSEEYSFKGAVLSTAASIGMLALLFTPVGGAAAAVTLLCEALFVASSVYWYRSTEAEHQEKYQATAQHGDAQANALRQEIKTETAYNKTAAALSLVMIFAAAIIPAGIPVGVVAGVLTLACAYNMYKGHMSARKQKAMKYDIEISEFKPTVGAVSEPEQAHEPENDGLVIFSRKERDDINHNHSPATHNTPHHQVSFKA